MGVPRRWTDKDPKVIKALEYIDSIKGQKMTEEQMEHVLGKILKIKLPPKKKK